MPEHWIKRGKEVLDIELEAVFAVRERLGEGFARAVECLGRCEGRVVVTGIGKSGLIGRKIAATLSSTGTPAFFLHPVEGAHGDLGSVNAGDVVLAISYSGKTDELTAILPALRRLGARIIALTSGLDSPLADLADIVVDVSVPREACGMNLVPTSSTTATLALGDALAVCLMDSKAFTSRDFRRNHPGGELGRRLSLCVGDLMHTDPLPLAVDSVPLGLALSVLDKGGYGAVILTDGAGALSGILTDGDLRRLVCRGQADMDNPAAMVMTRQPLRATAGMSVAELMDVMEQKGVTVLPVVDAIDNNQGTTQGNTRCTTQGAIQGRAQGGIEGKVIGIVHLHDILGKGEVRFAPDFRPDAPPYSTKGGSGA